MGGTSVPGAVVSSLPLRPEGAVRFGHAEGGARHRTVLRTFTCDILSAVFPIVLYPFRSIDACILLAAPHRPPLRPPGAGLSLADVARAVSREPRPAIRPLRPWDAVLFTGDLVQSGESAQFERMQAEVLDPLWRRLGELGSGGAVLLAVPGNHDLYRSQDPDSPALDVLLEKGGFERVAAKFWDQPAGSYRRVVHDAFAAYGAWWEQVPHRPSGITTGILPGDFAATLACGDRKIGLVGLNTTFLQLAGGDYQGRLVWDARQLHAVCEGGVDVWQDRHDVCLLLTHQG